MSRNPWKEIPKPQGESYFKTVRVDADLNGRNLPISWAVDYEGNRGVYFEYPRSEKRWKELQLPVFKALRMRDIECSAASRAFSVVLEEPDMDDLFFEICCDLVTSVQEMPPASTRTVLIRRLERWSSLLRGGCLGLSLEAQRGLFAELLFLEGQAMPAVGDVNAVKGWAGPEGAHQDFCFGQTHVEVKSKQGSSSNTVKISSEHQLAVNESERLFLCVIEENESNSEAGTTLSELVNRIKCSISSLVARNEYISKLLSIGYDFTTEYDRRWTTGQIVFYEVEGDFPRIASVEGGVSHVSYSLDLGACFDYMKSESVITRCLRGIDD